MRQRSVIEKFAGYADEHRRVEVLRLFEKVQDFFDEENANYHIGHTYFLVGGDGQEGTQEALEFKYRLYLSVSAFLLGVL